MRWPRATRWSYVDAVTASRLWRVYEAIEERENGDSDGSESSDETLARMDERGAILRTLARAIYRQVGAPDLD